MTNVVSYESDSYRCRASAFIGSYTGVGAKIYEMQWTTLVVHIVHCTNYLFNFAIYILLRVNFFLLLSINCILCLRNERKKNSWKLNQFDVIIHSSICHVIVLFTSFYIFCLAQQDIEYKCTEITSFKNIYSENATKLINNYSGARVSQRGSSNTLITFWIIGFKYISCFVFLLFCNVFVWVYTRMKRI